jgi:hypothetical protein
MYQSNYYLTVYVRLHLFQLRLLTFLIDNPKHLFDQLIAAVMTLTSTHFGIVRAIHNGLDDTVAGIMLILNAFIRIGYNVK